MPFFVHLVLEVFICAKMCNVRNLCLHKKVQCLICLSATKCKMSIYFCLPRNVQCAILLSTLKCTMSNTFPYNKTDNVQNVYPPRNVQCTKRLCAPKMQCLTLSYNVQYVCVPKKIQCQIRLSTPKCTISASVMAEILTLLRLIRLYRKRYTITQQPMATAKFLHH